ncbi:hypothetical protein NC653_036040 [Populus alba x Populus x berolinensis]|uniref:Uncharacterized protein n=1 Tax=Populus alba x Populus x berolinensis TaxID=444605 RepID=A0AAD6LKF6_9ROSI|nr:hypothetical protein NC653_036040 [Populus alba x Populus x berolinensis]
MGVPIDRTSLDCGRQCLQDTTMDWTGAAPTRNFGYVMLGILVMVAMEIGQEELEFWRLMTTPSISSHGSRWKMEMNTAKLSCVLDRLPLQCHCLSMEGKKPPAINLCV